MGLMQYFAARPEGKGGGVCIFIRNNICWERRHHLENESIENIWLELFFQNSHSVMLHISPARFVKLSLEKFQQWCFKQLIKQPTRITKDSPTIIDINAVNKDNIKMVKVKPTTMSDDDMVRFLRKINYKQFPSKTIRCRNFANYEPLRTSLKEELGHVDWDQVYNTSNVNQYTCLHQYSWKSFWETCSYNQQKDQGKAMSMVEFKP